MRPSYFLAFHALAAERAMTWIKLARPFGQQESSHLSGRSNSQVPPDRPRGTWQMADITTAGPLLHQVDRLFMRIRARDWRDCY
ncbi:hypothetical protein ASD99_00920 [Mesorhizobium sp. Root695]|nr:hypothetical protein ASD99_00920 [Mesorhizobium sp. Root695]